MDNHFVLMLRFCVPTLLFALSVQARLVAGPTWGKTCAALNARQDFPSECDEQ